MLNLGAVDVPLGVGPPSGRSTGPTAPKICSSLPVSISAAFGGVAECGAGCLLGNRGVRYNVGVHMRLRLLALVPLLGWSFVVAACGDSDGQQVTSRTAAESDTDTSAAPLEPDGEYCHGRTGADVTHEALAASGSGQPENESAWVMSAAGLAALDPELADTRTGGDTGDGEVFVVPVADANGHDLDPAGPVVKVDERTGHTGVVVLDCASRTAVRLLPDGYFPFGGPREFLDRTRWFTEWTAPDGRPATHKEISDNQWDADDHCSWPNVRMIGFNDASYVRDPDGVFADWPFETTLDLDAELPTDAVETGYRKGDVELWLNGPGDPPAAYLVSAETTERWPKPTDPIYCA